MAERSTTLKADLALLARFWPYARPHRGIILGALLSIPLVSLLGLAPPFLLMHGIDVNLMGRAPHHLLQAALDATGLDTAATRGARGLAVTTFLFLGFVLAEYATRSVQVFALQYAGQRSVGALRRALYQHVSRQAPAFFDRNPTGALLTRTTSDVEALGESLTIGAVSLLGDLFNIAAILLFMAMLSLELTLVSFALAPLLFLLVNFFRKRLRETFVGVRKTLAAVNGFFHEHVEGVEVVQLFNREERTYREFKRVSVQNLRQTQRSNIYDASLYAIMEGMATISAALLLWVGGRQVLEGALTLGLLVAFLEYIQRIFVPIKEFSGKFAILQQAVASMERIVDLLDTNVRISSGTKTLDSVQGHVRFDHVRFRYTSGGETVLEDVSFEVLPNEVVALVGPTGSGKTTVGKLLTRMYDGYEGRITVDGTEIRDLDLESVRRCIGVVQQDVVLFNGTIAFNISLGNPRVDRKRVEEAAAWVQADRFIQALPGAYDFVVTERGGNLSAGQAQLIALARIVAHDPPVVVLDEATASVDPHTEAAIQAAIKAILESRTVIVIAHRLSTVQAADKILVMRRGQIEERGRHEELLRANGFYATLYRQGTVWAFRGGSEEHPKHDHAGHHAIQGQGSEVVASDILEESSYDHQCHDEGGDESHTEGDDRAPVQGVQIAHQVIDGGSTKCGQGKVE